MAPTARDRPVLSAGETLIDLIASDGSTSLEEASAFVARPGGAPANVVVALARLEVPSAFCGVVGDDPFGRRLRTTLSTAGVDVSRLRATNEARTTIAFAWKDSKGDGHFNLLRMADVLLSVEDVEGAGISECAAFVFGSVALAAEPSRRAIERAVEIASSSDVPVCFDVNVRPTLWLTPQSARDACLPLLEKARLLKLSLDDAKYLFGEDFDADAAIARLASYSAPFIVLTDGSRGAWFSDRSERSDPKSGFVSAFEVEAIEPTGAGDAFTAAIIARLISNGWSRLREQDVRFASAAGAITTTRRGAMEALPTAGEIAQFLAVR